MYEKKINITESEWKIMQIIWKSPDLTLAQIKNELDKTIVWDRTTISTLLRRLRQKNVVGVKEARSNQYYPLVSEDDCLLGEIDSILSKLFYKSPQKLVATLAKHEDFSKEDIEEIEKLLSEIKESAE